MAKKTFVTQELRESVGQCALVTDAAMINAALNTSNPALERSGTCGACGHKIERHVGIKTPGGSMMWVGKCCAAILVAADAKPETVTPGVVVTVEGKEKVAISQEQYDAAVTATYREGVHYVSGGVYETYSRMYVNPGFDFVASIISQIDRYSSQEKLITVKQYDVMKRVMGW